MKDSHKVRDAGASGIASPIAMKADKDLRAHARAVLTLWYKLRKLDALWMLPDDFDVNAYAECVVPLILKRAKRGRPKKPKAPKPKRLMDYAFWPAPARVKPGRPPKLESPKPRKPAGRPRKDESNEVVVRAIRAEIERSGSGRRGQIKQAITALIRRYCEREGRSPRETDRALKMAVPIYQKLYSNSKNRFPPKK